MGGNRELLRQIARFFRDDSPMLIRRLRRAADERDLVEIRQAAHSLKGLVANFDADAAVHAAQRLEQMAQTGDASQARELVETLEIEVARLDKGLTASLEAL